MHMINGIAFAAVALLFAGDGRAQAAGAATCDASATVCGDPLP